MSERTEHWQTVYTTKKEDEVSWFETSPEISLALIGKASGGKPAAIVISPTDSKTAPEVLDAASKAGVPVVIADVGTNGGDYVTYVKSDNYRGAYDVGSELAAAFKEKGWNADPFALITISLARKNGQDRTNGFRDAMKDAGTPLDSLTVKQDGEI